MQSDDFIENLVDSKLERMSVQLYFVIYST